MSTREFRTVTEMDTREFNRMVDDTAEELKQLSATLANQPSTAYVRDNDVALEAIVRTWERAALVDCMDNELYDKAWAAWNLAKRLAATLEEIVSRP